MSLKLKEYFAFKVLACDWTLEKGEEPEHYANHPQEEGENSLSSRESHQKQNRMHRKKNIMLLGIHVIR